MEGELKTITDDVGLRVIEGDGHDVHGKRSGSGNKSLFRRPRGFVQLFRRPGGVSML